MELKSEWSKEKWEGYDLGREQGLKTGRRQAAEVIQAMSRSLTRLDQACLDVAELKNLPKHLKKRLQKAVHESREEVRAAVQGTGEVIR